MIDYHYMPVVAVFGWVLWCAGRVWVLALRSDPKRHITYFAQHQVVFAITLSVMAVSLSVITVAHAPPENNWLSKWWAGFDIAVALALLAQLRNLKHSLTAGRHG